MAFNAQLFLIVSVTLQEKLRLVSADCNFDPGREVSEKLQHSAVRFDFIVRHKTHGISKLMWFS